MVWIIIPKNMEEYGSARGFPSVESLSTTAIIFEERAARLLAEELGTYPISSAMERILTAVASETFPP